jgi:hypothetical protein
MVRQLKPILAQYRSVRCRNSNTTLRPFSGIRTYRSISSLRAVLCQRLTLTPFGARQRGRPRKASATHIEMKARHGKPSSVESCCAAPLQLLLVQARYSSRMTQNFVFVAAKLYSPNVTLANRTSQKCWAIMLWCEAMGIPNGQFAICCKAKSNRRVGLARDRLLSIQGGRRMRDGSLC